ncbi:MAG: hypothetical protein WDZ70_02390 [Candidatus Paceibacterota bacterium]
MNTYVIPAIIPEDLHDLEGHLSRLAQDDVREALGIPTIVQIDVMDGAYAPTKSWPYSAQDAEFDRIIAQERGFPYWDTFDFEIDMMTAYPEHHIDDWIKAGATSCIVHAASTEKFEEIQKKCRESAVVLGVAFRPSDDIDESLIEMSDFVQLMGNDKIGYHGVDLDERVFDRAETLREHYPGMDIAVDIGVDGDTAPDLIEVGVNKLVSGSYIFDSMDMSEAIRNLRGE